MLPRRCHRRARVPAIHAAGIVAHGKRDALFSISMNACNHVPVVMVIPCGASDRLIMTCFRHMNCWWVAR